jgi:hypothetical protein
MKPRPPLPPPREIREGHVPPRPPPNPIPSDGRVISDDSAWDVWFPRVIIGFFAVASAFYVFMMARLLLFVPRRCLEPRQVVEYVETPSGYLRQDVHLVCDRWADEEVERP